MKRREKLTPIPSYLVDCGDREAEEAVCGGRYLLIGGFQAINFIQPNRKYATNVRGPFFDGEVPGNNGEVALLHTPARAGDR